MLSGDKDLKVHKQATLCAYMFLFRSKHNGDFDRLDFRFSILRSFIQMESGGLLTPYRNMFPVQKTRKKAFENERFLNQKISHLGLVRNHLKITRKLIKKYRMEIRKQSFLAAFLKPVEEEPKEHIFLRAMKPKQEPEQTSMSILPNIKANIDKSRHSRYTSNDFEGLRKIHFRKGVQLKNAFAKSSLSKSLSQIPINHRDDISKFEVFIERNQTIQFNIQKPIKIGKMNAMRYRQRINASKQLLLKQRQVGKAVASSFLMAWIYKNRKVAQALLDECTNEFMKRSKLDSRDFNGHTALHYATITSDMDFCRFLLSVGANLHLQDGQGRTVLHYAAQLGSQDLIQTFIDYDKEWRETINGNKWALKKSQKSPNWKVERLHFQDLPQVTLKDIQLFDTLDNKKYQLTLHTKQAIPKTDNFLDWEDVGFRSALDVATLMDHFEVADLLKTAGARDRESHVESVEEQDLESRYLTSSFDKSFQHSFYRKKNRKSLGEEISVQEINTMTTEQILNDVQETTLNSILIRCVIQNNQAALYVLLERSAKVSASNVNHWNALHFAVKENNIYATTCMLEGFPRDFQQIQSTDEIQIEIQKPWMEDALRSMDAQTRQGWNVLHIAAQFSTPDLVRYLLNIYQWRIYSQPEKEPAADLLEVGCNFKLTPFLTAVKHKKYEMIKMFVSAGANIYAKNDSLQNALHIAAINTDQITIEFLVRLDSDNNQLRAEQDLKYRRPKDVNISSHLDFTHIWDHAKSGNVEQLLILIQEYRYGVNEPTPTKLNTPLHIATFNQQLQAMKQLMELGADPKLLNQREQSAIDIALAYDDQLAQETALKILSLQPVSNLELSIRQSYKSVRIPKSPVKKQDHGSFFQRKNNWEGKILIKELAKRLAESNLSFEDVFAMMDEKQDEMIDYSTFEGMLLWLGWNLDARIIRKGIQQLDANANQCIDYLEISALLREIKVEKSKN